MQPLCKSIPLIIASAFAPDFDIVAGEMLKKLDLNILTTPIKHGDFHNIAFVLLFATAVALVLRLAGMRFRDSFLFAGIIGKLLRLEYKNLQ